VKVAWVHKRFDASAGIARGYVSSAYYLFHALRATLGPNLVLDGGLGGSDPRTIHLQYCPPHLFVPIQGRVNVLFSMWEGDALPEYVRASLMMADALIVPSTYCQRVWANHGFHAEVVPLGVHDAYVAADPSRPIIEGRGRRLRFLSVGSAITRKGWELLGAAWEIAFSRNEPVQLWAKTIGEGEVEEHYGGGIVTDTRDLEPAEMLALYLSSDVFVSASFGEGFGLPCLEAMSTGCLAVAPGTGGQADFVSDGTAVLVQRSAVGVIEYGEKFKAAMATPQDLARGLRTAWEGWGTPEMEARRRRGALLAKEFCWTASAVALAAALERVAGIRDQGPGEKPENAPESILVLP